MQSQGQLPANRTKIQSTLRACKLYTTECEKPIVMTTFREFKLTLSQPAYQRDVYGQDEIICLPPICLSARIPNWEELIHLIGKGNQPNATELDKSRLNLLEDAILSVFYNYAQTVANSDDGITSDTFPLAALQWDSLSNEQVVSTWRRAGLSKKLAAFLDDYIKVMPIITGKEEGRVNLAATVMLSDFEQIKNDKKSVAIIRDQLVTYAEQAPNAPDHIEAIAYLLYKSDALLDVVSSAALDPSHF